MIPHWRRTLLRRFALVLAAHVPGLAAVPLLGAQIPDSAIVVEMHHEADSAFAMVLEAFAQAGIDVAITSAAQGLILSDTERIGRRAPYAYGQFRADLVPLGPITRVTLSGIVSPSEDLDRPVTVTAGSFFQGALIWARLQWVGRELKQADTDGDPAP